MPRYIKKIWSGDVYEAEEYYSRRKINKSCLRGPNVNGSSAEQQERNLKYARKKLARKPANKSQDLFAGFLNVLN